MRHRDGFGMGIVQPPPIKTTKTKSSNNQATTDRTIADRCNSEKADKARKRQAADEMRRSRGNNMDARHPYSNPWPDLKKALHSSLEAWRRKPGGSPK